MKLLRRFKKPSSRTKKRANHPKLVLIRQIVLGFLLMLLLAGLLTGIWYGSRIERLTIKAVEIAGGETIDHAMIRKIAEEELVGAYYRLVPKRFAWTYPEQKLQERIMEIDRIKESTVKRVSGEKIEIYFAEYQPFALWCDQADSGNCVFLDEFGWAFAQAPSLQGGALLRFSEAGQVPSLDTAPFSADFITTTADFIDRVSDELGLPITQVEKTGQDEIAYYISGGGELKVSSRMSVDETFDNLSTLLNSEAFAHIEPGNFQYIDLRYGNRVFVNEELAPTLESEGASSTATTTEEN